MTRCNPRTTAYAKLHEPGVYPDIETDPTESRLLTITGAADRQSSPGHSSHSYYSNAQAHFGEGQTAFLPTRRTLACLPGLARTFALSLSLTFSFGVAYDGAGGKGGLVHSPDYSDPAPVRTHGVHFPSLVFSFSLSSSTLGAKRFNPRCCCRNRSSPDGELTALRPPVKEIMNSLTRTSLSDPELTSLLDGTDLSCRPTAALRDAQFFLRLDVVRSRLVGSGREHQLRRTRASRFGDGPLRLATSASMKPSP